jgi:hypothetical protein
MTGISGLVCAVNELVHGHARTVHRFVCFQENCICIEKYFETEQCPMHSNHYLSSHWIRYPGHNGRKRK